MIYLEVLVYFELSKNQEPKFQLIVGEFVASKDQEFLFICKQSKDILKKLFWMVGTSRN